jgi:4-amino-4-deoxy-L-arabinose transferase-like glycosyltransferase
MRLAGLALIGLLLVSAGALVGNTEIERALLGVSSHSLSWGPSFFRLLLIFHGVVLVVIAQRLLVTRHREIPVKFEPKKTNWLPWLLLSLLSVLALGLRLWQLNTDLWFDELLTLLNYVRMPFGFIIARLPDQNNHIVFSLLSHASVQIFGESAWSVRLPSVVFGVLSLWALFLLGRRVLTTREALLACALATVSYHHIWFSQNARGYMGLLFFSILATWIWVEARKRNDWRWWAGYVLAVALGMWTHLTMAFVVGAHAIVYVTALTKSLIERSEIETRTWLQPLLAFLLATTVTLQLYALALPEFLAIGLHEVSLESEWTNPWWVVTETLRNLRIGFSGVFVVLSGTLMVGLGWWGIWRRDWQSGALMVLPPVTAGITMLALGHNLWPRFFFFAMGFALLIAIHGAMLLPELFSRALRRRLNSAWPEKFGRTAGFVLASLLLVASAITVPRNYAYPKQDYTGARDYVESQRGPDDVVVAVGLAGVAYKSYFAPNWAVAQTESELDSVRSGNKNVWLIYTIPVEVKAYRRDIWETIQTEFAVVKVFPGTLGGGEVVVCRQLPETQTELAMGQNTIVVTAEEPK